MRSLPVSLAFIAVELIASWYRQELQKMAQLAALSSDKGKEAMDTAS